MANQVGQFVLDRDLISLRNSSPAFSAKGNISRIQTHNDDKIVAFKRDGGGSDDEFIVVSNFANVDRNGYPVQGGSVRRDRNGRPVYAQPPAPLGSLGRQRVPMGGISPDDGRSGRSDRRSGSARRAGDHQRRRGTARRDAAARPRSGEPTVGGVRILPVIALLILVLAIVIAVRGLAVG